MGTKYWALLAALLAPVFVLRGGSLDAAGGSHESGDEPTGACCSLEAPFLCFIATRQTCSAGYAGDGTTCVGQVCDLCDAAVCDWCWVGTVRESNCPAQWNGDGECDCGCDFVDIDCPCGDGVCDATEDACTCPGDCPAQCGDLCCSENESRSTCPADCLDLSDAAEFWTCFTGPGGKPTVECLPFDLDADSDIDLDDYALFAKTRLGSP